MISALIATYPEFVSERILDMLIGSVDYNKQKFDLVLKELDPSLVEKRFLLDEAEKLQAILGSFSSKALISSRRIYQRCAFSQCAKIIFHIIWDTNQVYGPPIITISVGYSGVRHENIAKAILAMPSYLTISDQQIETVSAPDSNIILWTDCDEGIHISYDGLHELIYKQSIHYQRLL